MALTRPTTEQQALLDAIVQASGDLHPALSAQFEDALVVNEECPICFDIAVSSDQTVTDISRARLARLDSPLVFETFLDSTELHDPHSPAEEDPPHVLLWHAGGIVTSVEVVWTTGEHPELEDLRTPLSLEPPDPDIA
ncbi:hypothetical protein [Jonesia quinghaiensis]|uniref:hypothetical protein n=1 Tax=Jonesia quinghaiensis TaxID=262806 RepID=UPI0004041A71|nr:hypothetical protein [Jonesia quinghaiensis]